MTDSGGNDVEARKVSTQAFGVALTVIAIAFGIIQWAIGAQDKRIAVAEAKAEAAAAAANNYNFSLSLQLKDVQNDVKIIRDSVGRLEADAQRTRR
jgi:hypothetical protein